MHATTARHAKLTSALIRAPNHFARSHTMDMSILPYYTDEEVTQRLADLIGRQYAAEMLELVKQRTQRPARPIGFRYGVTLDFVPGRVNLMLDEEGRITGFEFN
jgi:hypothetical protein